MENVHKPHNLAAVIRSCDAVGIGEVHAISDIRHFRMRQKAASGSGKWVRINIHRNISDSIVQLKEQGFSVYCAHFSKDAVDFRDFDFTRKVALVFGSELEGVSQEAVDLADGNIVIPMLGMVQSLNVSVASALILYEAQRQRGLAGMYERDSIDQETIDKTLFEWFYPDVASYCHKHDLPYPELDEDGYMAEPLRDRLGNIRKLP
jgi:tRNA (guanosine-2'-O-)-methyltransferase